MPSVEIQQEGMPLETEDVEQIQAFPGLRRFIARAIDDEQEDRSRLTLIYRVKFGGKDHRTRRLDAEIISAIRQSECLSSRHSRYTLMAISAFTDEFPHARHLAGFDSNFFSSMRDQEPGAQFRPDILRRYGIAPSGHHGLACAAALLRLGQLGRTVRDTDTLLLCQVGSGVSITAIKGGKPLANTMAFASSDGPIMHKRSGNIEPGFVISLLHAGYPASNLWRLLNEQSGIFAASEAQADGEVNAADILKEHADTRIGDTYVRKIVLSLADYDLRFGPASDIVFSGGVANHSPQIVRRIIQMFEALRGCVSAPVDGTFGVDGPPWLSPGGRAYHSVSIDEQVVLMQLASDASDEPCGQLKLEIPDGICICAGMSRGRLILPEQFEVNAKQPGQIVVAPRLTAEIAYRSRTAAALLVGEGRLTDQGAAVCREANLPCLSGVSAQLLPGWAWDREVTVDCSAQEMVAI